MTRSSCVTRIVDVRNVTITLEEDVARWARVYAAEHDTSVSRLVGELLRRHMLEIEGYDAAMRRYLSVKPTPLKTSGCYPGRDEVHERRR